MKSLMLWLRRQQELSSLSSWRNLMKRISVRRPFSLILSMHFCAITLNCLAAYVSANDENGEKILHTAPSSPLPKAPTLPPKQGWCHPHNPCADSNLSTLSTTVCCHSGVDRWPGSPLSRSPAPDRRILSSSVPASPTNPMRRLIHSPSPLAQSEYAVQYPVILTNQLRGLVVVSALRLLLGTQH